MLELGQSKESVLPREVVMGDCLYTGDFDLKNTYIKDNGNKIPHVRRSYKYGKGKN